MMTWRARPASSSWQTAESVARKDKPQLLPGQLKATGHGDLLRYLFTFQAAASAGGRIKPTLLGLAIAAAPGRHVREACEPTTYVERALEVNASSLVLAGLALRITVDQR